MVKRFCSAPRHARREHAFTLAELLIVIAIIAVLIGILLPALSAARRSAASVKCLASLKDLGTAFQQYAQENDRYFPVVRWEPAAGTIKADENPTNTTNRVWIDFLVRYVHKRDTFGDPQKYKTFQNTSVFFGCPSYNIDFFQPDATDGRQYALGYGMSIYAKAPYGPAANGPEFTNDNYVLVGPPVVVGVNYAVIAPSGTTGFGSGKGRFYKMEQWARRGQDKGLLADSNGYEIVASTSNGWKRSDEQGSTPLVSTQPENMGMKYPLVGGSPTVGFVSVDATRHLAPTGSKAKVIKQKGVNMLFVDGHASTVSPREAWNAVRGAGIDLTTP